MPQTLCQLYPKGRVPHPCGAFLFPASVGHHDCRSAAFLMALSSKEAKE